MGTKAANVPAAFRDRIVELRRVPARDLLADPRNWRRHPKAQQDAMAGVLAEIGYADALLARETPEGLRLLDGHLRAATTPDQIVPVLILDLDEAEAAKLLLTLDPLAAMAETDGVALEDLLSQVQTGNAAVQAMIDSLAKDAGLYVDAIAEAPEEFPKYDDDIPTDKTCPSCGYTWSGNGG